MHGLQDGDLSCSVENSCPYICVFPQQIVQLQGMPTPVRKAARSSFVHVYYSIRNITHQPDITAFIGPQNGDFKYTVLKKSLIATLQFKYHQSFKMYRGVAYTSLFTGME